MTKPNETTPPFHYEVRFKLFAIHGENEVEQQQVTKEFRGKNLLKARSEALDYFNEYLSYITHRIEYDNRGNPKIIQPPFLSSKADTPESDSNERKGMHWLLESFARINDYLALYKESIQLFLVVDDEAFARKSVGDLIENKEGNIEREHILHEVASDYLDEQKIIDNLEMVELAMFDYLGVDTTKIRQTVYHYGEDYQVTMLDAENGAKREILPTPYMWCSLDEYNENSELDRQALDEFVKKHEKEKTSNAGIIAEETTNGSLTDIINKGESNQVEFKPTLAYDFKSKTRSNVVRRIIAKVICSFLNSNGGMLLIGVKDNGEIQGLEFDFSLFPTGQERDKIKLELDDIIMHFIGLEFKPQIESGIIHVSGKEIFAINVYSASDPVFLKDAKGNKEFYIRMEASSRQLKDIEVMMRYWSNRLKQNGNNFPSE